MAPHVTERLVKTRSLSVDTPVDPTVAAWSVRSLDVRGPLAPPPDECQTDQGGVDVSRTSMRLSNSIMAPTSVSGSATARAAAPSNPSGRPSVFVVGIAVVAVACVITVGIDSDLPLAARVATAISFGVAAAAARIDRRDLRLPNRMVSIIFASGVVAGLAADALPAVFLAAAIAAAPFLIMHLIEPGSIGFGDVKFSAACAAAIGTLSVLAAPIMVTVILSAAIINRLVHPDRARPLGPIVFVGTVATAIAIVTLQQQGALR
jgi:leader peptidase (prepilin peptidase)/N-methyltransferase